MSRLGRPVLSAHGDLLSAREGSQPHKAKRDLVSLSLSLKLGADFFTSTEARGTADEEQKSFGKIVLVEKQ